MGQQCDSPSKDARVMVRIIEVPQIEQSDLPSLIKKRKEVIHKISIRSNMQNPIKKWNLVSTDDFQNQLARFFRSKYFYYERRQNEWKYRKTELKSLKISQGLDIRLMSQLIASYHFNRKYLGPAIARGKLNELFEENAYSIIRETDDELAYQLFLLNRIISLKMSELKKSKKYIENLSGSINFSLFSYICKASSDIGVKWSQEEFTKILEREFHEPSPKWNSLIKISVDNILSFYKKQKDILLKTEEKELNYSVYFKNSSYISKIFNKSIPSNIRKLIKYVLKK
jgi:hypothetical protein